MSSLDLRQFPFSVAKIDKDILGADFLNKFKLITYMHMKKLIDGVTKLNVISEVASIM